MIKICYVVSNIDKALAFEWIAEKINNPTLQLSFLLLNPGASELEHFLKAKGVPVFRISLCHKWHLISALWKVWKKLRQISPDVVHAHLFEGSLVGMTAARLANIPKRIYTRHHATYHHEYVPKMVKFDKWINRMATDIVAISKNVQHTLTEKEGVKPEKIHLIHHGFKLEKFKHVREQEVDQLVKKYHLENSSPVVGVIAKYVELKGIQYIIPAFKHLLNDFPKAKLVLCNANGPYKKQVQEHLQRLTQDRYIEIKFEPNIFALYQLFDLYVHVPVNEHIEAFGQTYVEALAAGVPSIFTLSGVAPEFIKHKKNAWVVDFKDSDQIYKGMKTLLQNKKLSKTIAKQGQKDVSPFELDKMMDQLKKLYGNEQFTIV